MCGGEMGVVKCQICGKKDVQLQKTYFHYNFKCLCHSPRHFDEVIHCNECIPKEPTETKISISTENLKSLSETLLLIKESILLDQDQVEFHPEYKAVLRGIIDFYIL